MTTYSLTVLFSQFWTSPCFMSSSNCCFLTCLQVSQEAGKVSWCSHLFKNFPQLWSAQSKALLQSMKQNRCFFLNSLAFSVIQRMLAIWSLVPLPFLNPTCMSGGSQFTYYWSLAWRILIFAYGSLIMNWYLHSTVHQKITSRQKSYLYQCHENIACNNCLVTFYSGDTSEN